MGERRSTVNEAEEIERTVEALRAAVRREAGYLTEEDVPTGSSISAVRDAADLASVSAHLPLQSRVPVIGPLIVFVQRVLRLGLRWYINPIVEQQNAFNEAVVRALTEIEVRQADLARRIASPETNENDAR
jgi:hypothetical protein